MDTEEEFTAAMGRGVWIDDNPERIRHALRRGFDPNYNDNDGATTLHRIAEAGCAKAMSVFLQDEITRTDVKDHMQRTPLHYAVRCRNYENASTICASLLDAGLDINAESHDVDYPTPLFLCVKYMYIKLAAYLLDHGADIHTQNCCDVNVLNVFITEVPNNCHPNDVGEMLALLLYYNVDVNYCINSLHNHSVLAAFQQSAHNHRKAIIMQLKDYFVNYNFCPPVPEESSGSKYNAVGIMASTCTIIACINLKLENAVIFEFMKKLHFNYCSMIEILMHTSKSDNLTLFKYCLKYCKKIYKPGSYGSNTISTFFESNTLNKPQFLTGVETIFGSFIAKNLKPASICHSLTILFDKVSPQLQFQFVDMELILYQMLPFINTFCAPLLAHLFNCKKFTDVFEVFLMNDPLVLYDFSTPSLCDYCGTEHTTYTPPSTVFMHICNPNREIDYVPTPSLGMVPSLQWLSRNATRKHLRCKNTPADRTNPCHLFSYYNEVRKLSVPKIVKDIITLKHVLP